MGAILPGLTREKANECQISDAQYISYAVEHYLLIGLYTFLLILVVANIWRILIKQGRYKTLPLLAFYIFSFLAIALRLIYIISAFTYKPFIYFMNDCYLTCKLSVGLVQCWMILEIALRVSQVDKQEKNVEEWEKWMRIG